MWDRTAYQIELAFIRHGKTKANDEGRYLGRTDEDLSEEGKRELLERKKTGCYPKADMIITSPMKRCVQTAALLYPGLSALCVKEFREMDFGEFEGKNYTGLRGDDRYQAWIYSGGTLPFPGGESREKLIGRCRDGFAEMLAWLFAGCEEKPDAEAEPDTEAEPDADVEPDADAEPDAGAEQGAEAKPGEDAGMPAEKTARVRVALIVHGGTIMALLSSYGAGDYFDYQCSCGGGYRCLLRFNEKGEGWIVPASITKLEEPQ